MTTSEKITQLLSSTKSVTGKELTESLGISRQALNKHIQKLIKSGTIVKEGVTKGVSYRLVSQVSEPQETAYQHRFDLPQLEEDKAFSQIAFRLNLNRELRANVFEIFRYAFMEILNNAIDHSKSAKATVLTALEPYSCSFTVNDGGIGVFHSIEKKFNLDGEHVAVGELVKGKMTTAPEKHTGEGLFFTSKCSDLLKLKSHRLVLTIDNRNHDVILQESRFNKGTEVHFEIARNSKRKLENVFQTFAPKDFEYQFERTHVSVALFENEYLSRSEARRLLTSLDKFSEVILDFKNVKSLGRSFVDEVFRVFPNIHPDVKIKPVNLSPALATMFDVLVDNNE